MYEERFEELPLHLVQQKSKAGRFDDMGSLIVLPRGQLKGRTEPREAKGKEAAEERPRV